MYGRGSKVCGPQHNAVGAQPAGDVLQILLAHIGEPDLDFAADLLEGRCREANAAGLGDGFQAGGDVDAVAEDVVAIGQHITDVDADPELDLPLGRLVGLCRHAALNRDGAAHSIDGADKLDQHAIAGGIDDAASVLVDFGIDELAPVRLQPGERPLLVDADQPAVASDIGGQDGNDPTRRGGVAIGRTAAQHALDPRQQLARLKGFGDVVVGTGLQSDDAVHRIGGRGHHDDADSAAAFAQPTRQGEAVLTRQVDVAQDQRRCLTLDEPVQCRTTIDGADPEILLGQIIGEQLPLRRLVLDHDDKRPRVHCLPAGYLSDGPSP